MSMIGNLPEFIDYINDIQAKYLRPIGGIAGIAVQKMDSTTGAEKKKKAPKRLVSAYCDRQIPMGDCIITELNSEGDLVGFKVRPEMAKILMWREDGQNLSQICQTIRTVNYLNRMLLRQDDYIVGTIKNPPKFNPRTVTPSDIPEKPDEFNLASPDVQKLIDLLKSHSTAIISKGNEKKRNYQSVMQADQSFEDLLQYYLP